MRLGDSGCPVWAVWIQGALPEVSQTHAVHSGGTYYILVMYVRSVPHQLGGGGRGQVEVPRSSSQRARAASSELGLGIVSATAGIP
jgi:hypothetical protein